MIDYYMYQKLGENFTKSDKCHEIFGSEILGIKVRCVGSDKDFNIFDGKTKRFIAIVSSNASPTVADTGHNWGIWIKVKNEGKEIRIKNWAPLGLGPDYEKGDLYPKPISNFYKRVIAPWTGKFITNTLAKLYHHPDKWYEGVHIKEDSPDFILNIYNKKCFLSIKTFYSKHCIPLKKAFRKKPDNMILLAINDEIFYDESYNKVKTKIKNLEYYSFLYQNCSSVPTWIVEEMVIYNPSKIYGLFPTNYLDAIYQYNVK